MPSWPILLLAGREKSGKSWACAQASASDLVGRTLWVGIGEDDPDEYALIPGADFEIVVHDGTYRDILAAVEWATQQTSPDGKPVLVVVDSMTCLWELLCDMAQATANQRASRKGKATDEADIHMDLWNIAKSRFANVVDALRAHQGPALVTARLEQVTVMANGKPTTDKEWKVKTEKGLPYDVAGIVEMPERGKAYLTGVRTARMQVPERTILPGFTVDKLWHSLGLAEVEVGDRSHASVERQTRQPVAADAVPGQPQDDRTATAFRAAQAAANAADADTLAAIAARAADMNLMGVPVGKALTREWAAVTPGVTPAVVLAEWLTACVTHVHAASDSVAGTAAATPATDGADTTPEA